MFLDAIRIQRYRNIRQAEVEPNSRFNILEGANGQGKTNFLEAVYTLAAVKGFRPQTNATTIELGYDGPAILEGRVHRAGFERIVRIEIQSRGRKVFLNESPVRSLADFFGTLNVVVFTPEDIQLFKGSPSERRKALDRAIFNAFPAYAAEMQEFEDTLRQRNALLKSRVFDATLLDVYTEQFVQIAATIIRRRVAFIEDFRPFITGSFAEIFGGDHQLDIAYQSCCTIDENVETKLMDELQASAREERERGHTIVGPHRDDLSALLDGQPFRTWASQGQHRSLVLAMKISEIRYLERKFHFAPILLLDDVSSELDRDRNRFLFRFLKDEMNGQVFISTTHREHILLDSDVSLWKVQAGALLPG